MNTSHRQVIGALTSVEVWQRAVDSCDAVVHLAAGSIPGPDMFRFNLLSTYAMLEACRTAGVRRLLFASTNRVYGHCFPLSDRKFPLSLLPIGEDHPCLPEDNYGMSKLLNEQMLALYSRHRGIRAAAFRLSWEWGPEEIEKRCKQSPIDNAKNAWFFGPTGTPAMLGGLFSRPWSPNGCRISGSTTSMQPTTWPISLRRP